ncbi:MAG: oxygenase MpaB family protein [Ilumatobacteraceae bacterium]
MGSVVEGNSVREAVAVMAAALGQDSVIPEMREWFLDVRRPEIDPEKFRPAADAFARWSPQIATALFTASLPWAYAAANGVQVLERGSDLASADIRRRIAETAQMLVDVHGLEILSDGSFETDSQAFRTVLGVRLLHAAVRRALLNDPDWDDTWGLPINQEDLAGTLLTFTVVVFDALHRLGVRLSADEQLALLRLWRTVGELLGIDESLRPSTLEGARSLQRRVSAGKHQHRESAAGAHLMRCC